MFSEAQVTKNQTNPERTLDDTEAQKVLYMLALQMQANIESIKTWNGEYEFEDSFRFYGSPPVEKLDSHIKQEELEKIPYLETVKGIMNFSLNDETDELYVFYNSFDNPEFYIYDTKETLVKEGKSMKLRWIVTPEHFLELNEIKKSQLRGYPSVESVRQTGFGRILYRYHKEKAESQGRLFDPRDLFGNGSAQYFEKCLLYAQALSGERGKEIKEKASKAVSVVEITNDSNQKQYVVTNRYKSLLEPSTYDFVNVTYDSTVGYNPVRSSKVLGSKKFLNKERTFTYKEIDGIFIPENIKIIRYDLKSPDKKQIESRRIFKLKECVLNRPINPSQFKVDSLDLEYGERMLDTITDKLLVQDKTGLVPAEKFIYVNPNPPKNKEPFAKKQSNNFKQFLLFNLVVVSCLVLVFIIRGFVKSKSNSAK